MIPIPAIDLKDGKVVRLLHGNFKEEKVYFDEAFKVARRFEEEGAARLHVVDLDGALHGKPKNRGEVEKILKTVKMPVEIGGGIRSLDTAAEYFEMGLTWVILGTKACLDKGFTREAIEEFGDKVIIGIDALKGLIATDGWTKVTKIEAAAFARDVAAMGGRTIIYTDISKDGALAGPNLPEIKKLAESVPEAQVIASGGVGSLKDIQAIANLKAKNIDGVIIGKALYENKFTLKDAVKTCLQKG